MKDRSKSQQAVMAEPGARRALNHRLLHTLSHITAVGLSKDDMGKEVRDLQTYLWNLGYLRKQDEVNSGTFDRVTLKALKKYQRFYKVPETGKLDKATIRLMRKPRHCGVPDILPRHASRSITILANPWPTNKLTFYFANLDDSPDIDTITEAGKAISKGFSLWYSVSPIRWRHAPKDTTQAPAHLVIDWNTPGCGGLACSDWPEPDSSITRAYMRYDDDETWVVKNPQPGDADMIAFAAHEVGHILGLYWVIDDEYYSHSDDEKALMYPIIPAKRRYITKDDMLAAKRLYG